MTPTAARDPGFRIRYADEPSSPGLLVRKIYQWDRGFMPAMPMSASGGPKDYIKNQIFAVFEELPDVHRVVMVRASGPMFLLLRRLGSWYDVTLRKVTLV